MKIIHDGKEYEVADQNEAFWRRFENGSWEPETFKIFYRLIRPDTTFLDIGAWIGPTTLYAAKRAKRVFSFEPDPIAFFELCRNLELNNAENVVPYSIAVSNAWKGMKFGKKNEYGDSMSSELWGVGNVRVPAMSLNSVIGGISPDFIKIDIEGGEMSLFEGAQHFLRHHKPTIHLSLHTPWFKDRLVAYEESVKSGLEMYPYIYDENLEPIDFQDAFDPERFNSIVASFTKL